MIVQIYVVKIRSGGTLSFSNKTWIEEHITPTSINHYQYVKYTHQSAGEHQGYPRYELLHSKEYPR